MLYKELKEVIESTPCDSDDTRVAFLRRVEEGNLTRDENSKTHFCEYFLPYNPETKEVFMAHHKKSILWIPPGGHIDKGEGLNQTLNREIEEELGVPNFFSTPQKPFLLTTVDITNPKHPCEKHYDLWYLLKTDGERFHADPREFHETKWMSIDEAIAATDDESTKIALRFVEEHIEQL